MPAELGGGADSIPFATIVIGEKKSFFFFFLRVKGSEYNVFNAVLSVSTLISFSC